MADKPKRRRRKAPEIIKHKKTLRERNKSAAVAKEKPKRARKVASSVFKPVTKVKNFLKTEFHVLPRSSKPGFFSKSRRMTPSYFVDSIAELKNVTWPGRKETWKLVFAVFVFAMILGLFISVLDFGLDKIFRKVIL